MRLLLGDCLESLKKLKDNSVDSVVTDPPYGLSFMGKKWDYDVPKVELWREVLRVLKPGGHVLSFGGTRTYHRMTVNLEDAGFEIRDSIAWHYGSGFPKSQDISKAIDKQAGAEHLREISHPNPAHRPSEYSWNQGGGKTPMRPEFKTKPATDAAKQWSGWGTALKPATELIALARKPIEAKLTVAANVLKHGTGGLNIDAARVGTDLVEQGRFGRRTIESGEICNEGGAKRASPTREFAQGRWPANVLFDEDAAATLDKQSGMLRSGSGRKNTRNSRGNTFAPGRANEVSFAGDSGGASRFFYVAKASKSERNAGLEGMPEKKFEAVIGSTKNQLKRMQDGVVTGERNNAPQANHHPTVKPIKLMQYLVRMITPPGGTVLDPFMGSGTTGAAAVSLGFDFIGCEMSSEYMAIAKKRIAHNSPKQLHDEAV